MAGGLHNLQNCLDLMDLQLSRERHCKPRPAWQTWHSCSPNLWLCDVVRALPESIVWCPSVCLSRDYRGSSSVAAAVERREKPSQRPAYANRPCIRMGGGGPTRTCSAVFFVAISSGARSAIIYEPEEVESAVEFSVARETSFAEARLAVGTLDTANVPRAVEHVQQEPVDNGPFTPRTDHHHRRRRAAAFTPRRPVLGAQRR